MKKRKKGKYDRLVGGLGGGGGALLGLTVYNALRDALIGGHLDSSIALSDTELRLYMELRSLYINLGLFLLYTIIGFIMVILAVVYYIKGLIEESAEKVGKQESERYSAQGKRNSV